MCVVVCHVRTLLTVLFAGVAAHAVSEVVVDDERRLLEPKEPSIVFRIQFDIASSRFLDACE